MSNYKKLVDLIKKKKSFLCVGLDTDMAKVPNFIKTQFEFNRRIIDSTANYCIAFKINTAFYEVYGIQGWQEMIKTCEYIKQNYPHHLLILDAKRGDIGNTSDMYARTFFESLQSDAVTINPYMGSDSISPFLNYKNKWSIVLGLTSNLGSSDFQLKGEPKNYLQVLESVSKLSTEDNLMFVIGATKAELLQEVRKIVPNHFLLIPGVGHQGGSLQDVVKYGFNQNCGLIVNLSRSIIFATNESDFDIMAGRQAQLLQLQMMDILLRQKFI